MHAALQNLFLTKLSLVTVTPTVYHLNWIHSEKKMTFSACGGEALQEANQRLQLLLSIEPTRPNVKDKMPG